MLKPWSVTRRLSSHTSTIPTTHSERQYEAVLTHVCFPLWAPNLWCLTQPGRWSFVWEGVDDKTWTNTLTPSVCTVWEQRASAQRGRELSSEKAEEMNEASKINKGEKWKTTVQQAFSPVYRQNTAALLYCLALLLGPDRPFNAVEPSVRGCHQKKSTGDQRTVGQGRATVRGHNQLEHLELRAGTQKTHTLMLMHKHSYTHVRWPCGGTHKPLFQCICLHMSKQR